MPIIRALVTLPAVSALPEDSATNTWHFQAPLTNPTSEMGFMTTALTNFYQAIDQYLSPKVGSTATIRYYNLSDPKPRVPLGESTIPLTVSSGTALPSELAVCLSYQAAKISGTNQARRRGRIYIGPLGTIAAGTTSASDRPLSSFVSAIASAATALEVAAFANGTPWHVYSPTSGTSAPVTDGWVDNAFDVQRRRGLRVSSKTLWS